MSMSRKDSKGRVLRKGESQRKNDGRYIYQYTDSTGKRRVVFSNELLELREKEKELVRNQLDGLESYCSGKTTLNYAFDRYISTKYDLKEHTRVNYKYMYNRFVRDTFGKRIINDIKYSDVKFFYCSLMNILGLQANTLDNIFELCIEQSCVLPLVATVYSTFWNGMSHRRNDRAALGRFGL